MNNWKQPIPTNLRKIFGDDHLARLIYVEFLLRASNSSGPRKIGDHLHFLERGQCVCGQAELGEMFNRDRRTIKRALKRLNRMYNRVHNHPTPMGTIITIKDYDEVVSMHNQTHNRVHKEYTTHTQPIHTNKSVESDKSERKNKNICAISEHFKNQIKENALLTDSARKKIKTRLKVFSVKELKKAIDNFSLDSWHMKHNGHRPMSWFFYNNERIESYRDMEPRTGDETRKTFRSDNQPEKGKYDKYS